MPQKVIKMMFVSLMLLSYANLIMSCSSSQKTPMTTDMANTGMGDTIANAEQKVARAYEEQWDVLATSEIKRAAEDVEKAKKNYAAAGSMDSIAKELREFDADYKQAQLLAQARAPRVEGLLAARRKVLDSGIRAMPNENKVFAKLDDDFRVMAGSKSIDVKDFSKLQGQYMRLAAQTEKNANLLKAKQQIEFAINNKAHRYAPRALNMAELDMKSAENMMGANIDNPQAYEPSVRKAKLSAAMVAAIIDEQRKANYNLDEGAARKIVQQRGVVAQLSSDLRNKNEELYYSQAELQAYQKELEGSREDLATAEKASLYKDTELAKAEKEKRFQTALESAQKQFTKTEADVYRQGDKILIRLKKMEFPVGKATVPEKSKPLLDKVVKVAKQLGPQEVVVEGHTDSVGAAAVNTKISQERADSVMGYLETDGIPSGVLQSVGYGFDKPLGSNKTKTGRAQNRRVDIWITPSADMKATE